MNPSKREMLEQVEAGNALFVWSARGWLVVGPVDVVVARAVVRASGDRGKATVRITRVVGTFERDGVRYATAVFTTMPAHS